MKRIAKSKLFIISGCIIGLSALSFTGINLYKSNLESKIRLLGSSVADEVVSDISQTLTHSGSTIKVYDSTGLNILNISNSNNLKGVYISEQQASLFNLTGDNLYNSVLSKCNVDISEELAGIKNPLSFLVNSEDIIFSEIKNKLTPVNAISYLLSISDFGELGKGIENASLRLYNKDVKSLTLEQLELLSYFYNTDKNFDEIVLDNGYSVTQLNKLGVIYNSKQNYSNLSEIIENEISSLLGDTEYQNLSVKVSINSKQQRELQSLIDNTLAENIDLSSSDTYSLDSSVAVIDSNTGYITAFVPSRKQPNDSNIIVKFNNSILLGDFTYSRDLIQSGSSKNTLVSVEDENGVSSYFGLDEVTVMHLKSSSVDLGSIETTQNVIQSYQSFTETDTKMVLEILDENGKVLYTAPNQTKNVTVQSELFDDLYLNESKSIIETKVSNIGTIYMSVGKNYGISLYVGSVASGYTKQIENPDKLIADIINICNTYYATTNDLEVILSENAAAVISQNQVKNFEILKSEIDSKMTELTNVNIISVDTRKQFETLYSELSDFLLRYKPYLNNDTYNSIVLQQEQIRRNKSSSILENLT